MKFASAFLLTAAALQAGVYFEPNRGQLADAPPILAHTPRGAAGLGPDHAEFRTPGGLRVPIRFPGATHSAPAQYADRLPGVSHYVRGADPQRWLFDIPHYAAATFNNVYTGIDLRYRASGDSIEIDFLVGANADTRAIRFAFHERVQLSATGELLIGSRSARLKVPRAWQTIEGRQTEIPVKFQLANAKEATFALGKYDRTHPLVIDPVVEMATYVGGSSNDGDTQLTVDENGHIYLAGTTNSADFPAALPDEDLLNRPVQLLRTDLFISRMTPDGKSLDWSLFYGGSGSETALGLERDSLGNLYVLGGTTSLNLPLTPGAYRTQPPALQGADLFLAKLDGATGRLKASTYLGIPQRADLLYSRPALLAVDATGGSYVSGPVYYTCPTTPGAFQTASSDRTVAQSCMIRLNASLTALVYGTAFRPGSISSMRVDAAGNVYFGGQARIELLAPEIKPLPGVSAPTPALYSLPTYIAKLDATGSKLLFASWVNAGGSSSTLSDLKLDDSGNLLVLGSDNGTVLPPINPLQLEDSSPNVGTDPSRFSPFLIQLPADGGRLLRATLFTGPDYSSQSAQNWPAKPQIVLAGQRLCLINIGLRGLRQTSGALGYSDPGSSFPYVAGTIVCTDDSQTRINLKTILPYEMIPLTAVPAAPDSIVIAGTSSGKFATTPGVFQPRYGGSYSSSLFPSSPGPLPGDAAVLRLSLANPMPRLQTVTPQSLILTTSISGVTFDLGGENFAYGTEVRLNGERIDAVYPAPGKLTVPSVDISLLRPGTDSVTVSLPGPGGGMSETRTVLGINGAPLSAGVSPSTVTAGTGEVKLVIAADNLTPDSILRWDGRIRTARFVYAFPGTRVGRFELVLPAEETAIPGPHDLTITNPGPGGGVSPVTRFVIQPAAAPTIPSLAAPPSYLPFNEAFPLGPKLSITGTNFTGSLRAYWDGSEVPSEYVSPSRINIQPPAGSLNHWAAHALYVESGGYRSNTVRYLIARRQTFSSAVMDPVGRRLYGLEPGQGMDQPSALLTLNAADGAIVSRIEAIMTGPTAMAISADGRYLYIAGGRTDTKIRRYNTVEGSFDLEWTLGPATGDRAVSVRSLATPRDQPETVMVAVAGMVVIYDRDQRRPRTSTDAVEQTPMGDTLFVANSRIYVSTQNGYCWAWLQYDASGITGGEGGCLPRPPDLQEDHGFLYLTDGVRVKPVYEPDPSSPSGPMSTLVVADLPRRRVFQSPSYSAYAAQLLVRELDTSEQRSKGITFSSPPAHSNALFLTESGAVVAIMPSILIYIPE